MMTQYFVYDVFTDTPFGGNQLAVIPDATALPEDQLQKIAQEFNFSEVTFVYPPDDPAHTAKVRIFTPTRELPFAGHPTIGTALALRDEGHTGDMVLELGIGPVPCRFTGHEAAFTVSTPLERLGSLDAAFVASTLNLPTDAIKADIHAPIQAGVGLPFILVELHDKSQLQACAPVLDLMREGAKKLPAGISFAIFVYIRNEADIEARMFAPLGNIPEDPATGSASAALAALLTDNLGRDLSLNILQGEAMGRPSRITASTRRGHPTAVTISGQAIRTMQGTLLV